MLGRRIPSPVPKTVKDACQLLLTEINDLHPVTMEVIFVAGIDRLQPQI